MQTLTRMPLEAVLQVTLIHLSVLQVQLLRQLPTRARGSSSFPERTQEMSCLADKQIGLSMEVA